MRIHHLFAAALASALAAVACGNTEADDDGAAGAAAAGSPTSGGSAGSTMSGGSAGTSAAQGGSSAGNGASGKAGTGGSGGGEPVAGKGAGGSADAGATNGGTGGVANAGGSTAGTDNAGTSAGGSAGTETGGDSGAGTSGGSGGGDLPNAVPSEGCSLSTPSTLDGEQTFDVDGTEREFIIRLPEGYDGQAPNRIIFAFHGASGSAVQVDNGDPPNPDSDPTGPYYGIKEHADARTIFVAGQAMGTWGSGDIAYVETLLAKLKPELCLDESRILATGFSMGGIMTVRVACNLSDVFRAVAPMSCSLSAANCPDDGGPVAYWSSHGEEDTTITIPNGEAARDEFVDRNGCDASATPEPIGDNGCVAYQDCDPGYPVNWCPFTGVHEPPTFSGPEIWAFLSQF